MRDEFGFEAIRSVEFCVSVKEDHGHENYLVPSDQGVQDALRAMLHATVRQLENTHEFGGPRSLDRNWADLRESPTD